MDNVSVNTSPKGIGGWFGVFALLLCVGFLMRMVETAHGLPDYLFGFRNEAARVPLVAVGLMTLAGVALHLGAIVALFLKKRVLRAIYVSLWIVSFLTPLMLLPMLTVPGVTLDVLLPAEDIARMIIATATMGLWCWYLCASVRVKNTLVD